MTKQNLNDTELHADNDIAYFVSVHALYMPQVKTFFESRSEAVDFLCAYMHKHFPYELVAEKFPSPAKQDDVLESSYTLARIDKRRLGDPSRFFVTRRARMARQITPKQYFKTKESNNAD